MLVTKAAVQRGRVGADLGHRRRRRDRGLRDLPGARRAHDRHLGERREARAGARMGRGRRGQPPHGRCRRAVKEATGGGVDVVVETVGEATWARSLGAVAPGGAGRGVRRHERPEPTRRAAPLLVEAADGATARRWARATTSSAPTSSSAAAGRGCTSTRCSRSPRPGRARAARGGRSSSARSCFRFPERARRGDRIHWRPMLWWRGPLSYTRVMSAIGDRARRLRPSAHHYVPWAKRYSPDMNTTQTAYATTQRARSG